MQCNKLNHKREPSLPLDEQLRKNKKFVKQLIEEDLSSSFYSSFFACFC